MPKKVNKDLCFVDFTYKKDDYFRPGLVSALDVMDSLKESMKKANENGGNNSNNNIVDNELKRSVVDLKTSTVGVNNNNFSETMKFVSNNGDLLIPGNATQTQINQIRAEENIITTTGNRPENAPKHSSSNSNGLSNNTQQQNVTKVQLHKSENNSNSNISDSDQKLATNYSSNSQPFVNNIKNKQTTELGFLTSKSNSRKEENDVVIPTINTGSKSITSSQGNMQKQLLFNNDRTSGSDYLLKNNSELEKQKLKVSAAKQKLGSIQSNSHNTNNNPFSPGSTVNKESSMNTGPNSKIKKINPIQVSEVKQTQAPYMNINSKLIEGKVPIKKSPTININDGIEESGLNMVPSSNTSTKLSIVQQTGNKKSTDKMPKVNFPSSSSNVEQSSRGGSNIITTNYLKDVINSESNLGNNYNTHSTGLGVGKMVGKNISTNVVNNSNRNQLNINLGPVSSNTGLLNNNAEIKQERNSLTSKYSFDPSKPLSTKNSTGKKIAFSGSASQQNTNQQQSNFTNPFSSNNLNVSKDKFQSNKTSSTSGGKDSSWQSQRNSDKMKNIK
jgi:hypothetical protein